MSCYFGKWYGEDALILKCDVCGGKMLVICNETDRLLKHDYMKQNGWRRRKESGKWKDICAKCLNFEKQSKRKKFFMNR